PLWAALFNRTEADPKAAEEAMKKGDHKQAAELFGKLLKEDTLPADLRQRYAQALGYSTHQLKDYDRAVGAFSQALESGEPQVQKQAHQGLAHSLYDQGDRSLAKQPKFTIKAWRDAVKHFDAILKMDPENKPVIENREFIKKRVVELQKKLDEEEQKGDKGKKGDKKKGKKGQKGEEGEEGEEEEGDSGEEGDQDGEGKKNKDLSRKESLGKQKGEKKEEELPEGELKAAKEGDPKDKGKEAQLAKEAEAAENEKDDATGFSRNEARSFLRTYADDQKKAQIVRPRDPAVNGKDW
ncbi:MAG TPA: hypothetical protein DCP71_10605, partial [Verrucomicrobiales bacterium]|nr:hypothetical protein [Verrucomicrobiales bacterium]